MDAITLRKLSRPELQKLASANQIKANLKSDTIITLLLERNIQGTQKKSSSRISRKVSSPSRKSKKLASVKPHSPVIKARMGRRSLVNNSAASLPPVNEGDAHARTADHTNRVELGAGSRRSGILDSTSSLGVVSGSLEGSLQPPAAADLFHLFRDTVERMKAIAEEDKKSLDRIAELHSQARKLRKRAETLRTVCRSEKLIRQKLEDFANYWQYIRPQWTWEEVWRGKKNDIGHDVTGITSSDEEAFVELDHEQDEDPERLGQGHATVTQLTPTSAPEQMVPQEYAEATQAEAVTQARYDAELHDPKTVAHDFTLADSKNKGKRVRSRSVDNSDEDEVRYKPRSRSCAQLPAADASISATPRARRVTNKGKGKMTPDQVERMNLEAEVHAADT